MPFAISRVMAFLQVHVLVIFAEHLEITTDPGLAALAEPKRCATSNNPLVFRV